MRTEQSIRILLSLFVTIEQNYNSLTFFNTFLAEDKLHIKKNPPRQDHCIDEAIIESLWFQIIIKSCSFLEEWDRFLAVRTNEEDKEKILLIKKIVKPARQQISEWKDMQKFRNEIIAHNSRNKEDNYSLDNMGDYDCPSTEYELFHLVKFLERMIKTLTSNFPAELQSLISKSKLSKEKEKYPRDRGLEYALKEVDKNIFDNFESIN
jgi:hypothetical protein